MFQNLHKGAKVYLLDKSVPKVDIAEIDNIVVTPHLNTYNANQYAVPNNVLDIRLKVGTEYFNLKDIPAMVSEATFANDIVLCENKTTIISELEAMKAESENILNKVEKHKDIVEKCSELLQTLNPEVRRDIERSKEIDTIKSDISTLSNSVANMTKDFGDIKAMLSRFMKQKNIKEE